MSPRRLGLLASLGTLAADQANKLWLIFVFGIELHQPLRITSFFDIVYAKNPGISYSLLPARTGAQRLALLLFISASTAFLALWLWRAGTRVAAFGLGLIIGGALGNFYDRLAYGFVADFYHFHLGSFSWYVFNVADVAIVLGTGMLVYDAFVADKKPPGRQPAGRE
ncbi:MAG: signal peptidase II [Methylocapsa sp.]|nr:signal peptidase II [Methylocapsa sp.]